MPGFETEISRKILIHDFRVYMDPDFFFEPTYSSEFEFLARSQSYNEKFKNGNPLENLLQGLKASPLSKRDIDKNKFWNQYHKIGSTHLTAWDRQEPVRVYIPMQFVPYQTENDRIKMHSYPPEVFLFPSGWASLLKFSLHGEIPHRKLPELIRFLSEETWITQKNSEDKRMNLNALINKVRGIVQSNIYMGSKKVRQKSIIENRIIEVLDRENPTPHRNTTDEADSIVYSTILGREVSLSEIHKVSDIFNKPISKQFLKMKYKKEGIGLEGWAYINYQSGIFLDLPTIQASKFVPCLAYNLHNLIIMVNLLANLIIKGSNLITEGSDALNSPIGNKWAQERQQNFNRLITNAQKVLKEIASWDYSLEARERLGKAYVREHILIKKALEYHLPDLTH